MRLPQDGRRGQRVHGWRRYRTHPPLPGQRRDDLGGEPGGERAVWHADEIDKYDAAIFGCVGSQQTKTTAQLTTVLNYANKGGRVFATHFSYVWLNTATTWGTTANKWAPGTRSWNNTSSPGSLSAIVDTSFPKGVLFSTWLQAPVAPMSATFRSAVLGSQRTVRDVTSDDRDHRAASGHQSVHLRRRLERRHELPPR